MTQVTNDDLDFGIQTESLQINLSANNKKILKPTEINNPFFVPLNNRIIHPIERSDVYRNYAHIIVLCVVDIPKEHQPTMFHIFKQVITKKKLDFFKRYLVIVPVGIELVRNNKHFDEMIVVRKEFLQDIPCIDEKLDLDESELVVPMFGMSPQTVLEYVRLYRTDYDLSKLIKTIQIVDYMGASSKYLIPSFVKKIIANIPESFWCQERNCHINFTELFGRRVFKWDKNRIEASQTLKETLKRIEVMDQNITIRLGNKQIEYQIHPYQIRNYANVGQTIREMQKRTYYPSRQPANNYQDVDKVFDLLELSQMEKEMCLLFNSLASSKEFCHLVVNNKKCLEHMKPIFQKYNHFYRYLLGYPWLSFYIEECLAGPFIKTTDRFVFDIDTASKLPHFPWALDNLQSNPYITLMCSSKMVDAPNNCLALPYIDGYKYYGINDLKQFQRNFALFTSGQPEMTIFDGLDWNNVAISGSTIPACTLIRSPLCDILDLKRPQSDDNLMTQYFDSFYKTSDIDVICNCPKMVDYLKKVEHIQKTVLANLIKITKNQNVKIELEPVKQLGIYVTQQFFEELKDDINRVLKETYTTEELVYGAKNNRKEIYEYLYKIYIIHKNSQLVEEKRGQSKLVDLYLDITPIECLKIIFIDGELANSDENIPDHCRNIRIGDLTKKSKLRSDTVVVKVSENIKFKLRSESMKRSLELFQMDSSDFAPCVAKFHLPCVRGYYNGKNVYLMPSCITALMTGINIDYKYFAGIRNPIEILQKYRTRGFSTIINKAEKSQFAFYVSQDPALMKLYNLQTPIDQKKIFGPKKIDDPVYKNGANVGYKNPNPNIKYLESQEEINKMLANGMPVKPTTLILQSSVKINESGNIEPYKDWLFGIVDN